jgi:hypothetical protein
MGRPFTFRARGVVRGVAFVSDGAVLLRADVVAGAPDPNGVAEIPEGELAQGLTVATGSRPTVLAELEPATAGAFRTRDGVGLAERHVELLRALGRPITLWTAGPKAPIRVAEGGTRSFGTSGSTRSRPRNTRPRSAGSRLTASSRVRTSSRSRGEPIRPT